MDGKTATTSVEAAEVEGEGMTARTRKYECLFPGVPARCGAHADEGNEEDGVWARRAWPRLGDCSCGQGLDLAGRDVNRTGAIPVLGRSARATGDVPECVREGCEMKDEKVEAEEMIMGKHQLW